MGYNSEYEDLNRERKLIRLEWHLDLSVDWIDAGPKEPFETCSLQRIFRSLGFLHKTRQF